MLTFLKYFLLLVTPKNLKLKLKLNKKLNLKQSNFLRSIYDSREIHKDFITKKVHHLTQRKISHYLKNCELLREQGKERKEKNAFKLKFIISCYDIIRHCSNIWIVE